MVLSLLPEWTGLTEITNGRVKEFMIEFGVAGPPD
jgi:hypothetical protein